MGRAREDSSWRLPYEMPWLQREITLLTGGATTVHIIPPNLPILKVVVLPIKVSSFTKIFLSSIGKKYACNPRRPRFDSWVGKICWRRERPPTPVFWPGDFHGLQFMRVAKIRTRLSHLHFHFPLELLRYLLNCLKNYVSQNWLPLASFQVLHKPFST